MSAKNIFLTVLILLLAGFFLYLNRDWFVSEKIQISHRSGPPLRFGNRFRQNNQNKAVTPLFFELNRKLNISSVKVIPVSAIETNRFPHPIWHIVPILHPVATRGFEYGASIPGMEPSVRGDVPDPLEPGVKYRLIVEAGSLKAEHDFIPDAPAR